MTCPDCLPGFGRGEGCKCVICIPGKTYSSNTSPDGCEPCRKCKVHEEEDSACTINKNRSCKCKKTFARHRVTDDCTQCCICKTDLFRERTPACMDRKDERHCMAKSHVGICDEDSSSVSVNPTQSTVFQQMNESMAVRGSTLYQEILSTSSTSSISINPTRSIVENTRMTKSMAIKDSTSYHFSLKILSTSRYHSVTPNSTMHGIPTKSIITDYHNDSINNTYNPYYIFLVTLPLILFIYLVRKAWKKRKSSTKRKAMDELNQNRSFILASPTELTLSSLQCETFEDLEKALESYEAWKVFGYKCVDKFESDGDKRPDLYKRIEGCGQPNIAETMFGMWEKRFPQRTVKILRERALDFDRQDIIQCLEGIPDERLLTGIKSDLKLRLCSRLNSVVPTGIKGDCKSFFGKDFQMEEINNIITDSAKDTRSSTWKMMTLLRQEFGTQPLYVLSDVSENMGRQDVKTIFNSLIQGD